MGWIRSSTPWCLVPALRELLPKSGIEASAGNVGYYGGVFFALFMIGYGVALVWGPIADRFGRVRTMMLSILCFSLFTMLTGFSTGLVVAGDFPLHGGSGDRRGVVRGGFAGF